MYRFGDSVLQLVLNGSGAHEEKVLLNELSDLFQLARPVREGRVGLLIFSIPLTVFLLRELAVGKAERPETVSGVVIQVFKGVVKVGLLAGQPLQDHGVRSLDVDEELALLRPHNGRHALPRRGKLKHSQDLVFHNDFSRNPDGQRVRLPNLGERKMSTYAGQRKAEAANNKLIIELLGTLDNGGLIWGGGLVLDLYKRGNDLDLSVGQKESQDNLPPGLLGSSSGITVWQTAIMVRKRWTISRCESPGSSFSFPSI